MGFIDLIVRNGLLGIIFLTPNKVIIIIIIIIIKENFIPSTKQMNHVITRNKNVQKHHRTAGLETVGQMPTK